MVFKGQETVNRHNSLWGMYTLVAVYSTTSEE